MLGTTVKKLLAIVAGRCAYHLLEHLAEVIRIVVADLIGDFLEAERMVGEQLLRLLHPAIGEEVNIIDADLFLEHFAYIIRAQMDDFRNAFQ